VVGAGLYWLFMMGGIQQVQGFMGDISGQLGIAKGGGSSQTSTGKNSWTDEDGNNFNIDSDVRTQSNVQGNASASKIQGDVQSMLQKMGVDMNKNNGSKQNISKTRQVDTTGKAKQTQTKSQKSNHAFYQSNFGRMSLR